MERKEKEDKKKSRHKGYQYCTVLIVVGFFALLVLFFLLIFVAG